MNVNMVAPYEGVLEWVGAPNGGVSQNSGNEWKTVDFVLKYMDHQMQDQHIVFSLSGVDKVNRLLATPVGTRIRVTWTPGARKWVNQQGETKWFAQYNALGFLAINDNNAAPQGYQQQPRTQYNQQPAQSYQQPRQNPQNDLPF